VPLNPNSLSNLRQVISLFLTLLLTNLSKVLRGLNVTICQQITQKCPIWPKPYFKYKLAADRILCPSNNYLSLNKKNTYRNCSLSRVLGRRHIRIFHRVHNGVHQILSRLDQRCSTVQLQKKKKKKRLTTNNCPTVRVWLIQQKRSK
jgi:hypothetical protein